MRYKLLLILAIILQFSQSAISQIVEPITWHVEEKKVSSTEIEINYTATIEQDWHLYATKLPEGGPIATTITYKTLQGVELIGELTPSKKATEEYQQIFELVLSWYTQTVTLTQRAKITSPNYKIEGNIRFMGCNNTTCLPPTNIDFSLASKGNSANQTPAQQRGNLQSFNFNSTKLTDAPAWQPVTHQIKEQGGATSTTDYTLWYIFIAGFIGGLLALATPCVWPMIPMTVSFFIKQSGTRRKAVTQALLFGLAIIIIYLTLGLLITTLFGASALNDLSTNAFFNIFFALLLVLFAASFFGAFNLELPAKWTTKLDAKADSTTGFIAILLMAFTLALVSFSCTGPIIGFLLVEAATSGVTVGPAVGMFAFALALAIPFALFALFPTAIKQLPKSGGWLNSVKVVLAFVELAFALKFLSVADLAYGWGILPRETFISLWIVISLLTGLYLLGLIRFKSDTKLESLTVTRLFLAIIPLTFAVYMIPGLWGAPLKAISAFAPPASTQDFNLYDGDNTTHFTDYDKAIEYAQKENKPLFIDFSGYGCVNCRKMEAAVFTDPKVEAILNNNYVFVTLMVDSKKDLPTPIEVQERGKTITLTTEGDKWSYLQRYKFGANAQPYYILLSPDGKILAPPYGYNENIQEFVNFLKSGLGSK